MQKAFGSALDAVTPALVGPDPEIRVLHLNNDGLATSSPLVFNTLRERVYFPSACHVPAVTPDMLAKMYGNKFDFVSIDAEGMDMYILKSAGPLLSLTRLICIDKDMPGMPPNALYRQEMLQAAADQGFMRIVQETSGNLILAR